MIIQVLKAKMVHNDRCDGCQSVQLSAISSRKLRAFLLGWVIYAFLIGLFAVRYWIPQGLAERMDFRSMYAAGVLVRTNPTNLYDLAHQKRVEDTLVSRRPGVLPFNHLPYEALIFLPISLLKYRDAYLCILFFNALLIFPCFFLARENFSALVNPWQPRPGLIFFIYLPVVIALAHGQDSMLLLLICCLTWHQLTLAKHFSAGGTVALALFKPHLALLLGFLLCIRYGWRFLAGFVAGGVVIAMMCILIVRVHGINSFMAILKATSLVTGQNEMAQNSVGVFPKAMPNLRGLLYAMGSQYVPSTLAFGVVSIASLVLLGWVVYVIRGKTDENAFALSIFCTVLLSYNFQVSDLTILLLPIVMLAARTCSRFLRGCLYTLFLLPPLLLILSNRQSANSFYLLSLPILAITILITRMPQPLIDMPPGESSSHA